MATHAKAGEIISIVRDGTVQNADIRTARATLWIPMKDYKRVAAYATGAPMTLTKKITATLQQAKDSSGTGAKALATASSAGAATTEDVRVEVGQDEMDGQNGFTHVKLIIQSDNDAAHLGFGLIARLDPVYKPV